jgi:hypothetical protein
VFIKSLVSTGVIYRNFEIEALSGGHLSKGGKKLLLSPLLQGQEVTHWVKEALGQGKTLQRELHKLLFPPDPSHGKLTPIPSLEYLQIRFPSGAVNTSIFQI